MEIKIRNTKEGFELQVDDGNIYVYQTLAAVIRKLREVMEGNK